MKKHGAIKLSKNLLNWKHTKSSNHVPFHIFIELLLQALFTEDPGTLTVTPEQLSDSTGCKVEDIKIDMQVGVYFDDVTDKISLPKFKPAI